MEKTFEPALEDSNITREDLFNYLKMKSKKNATIYIRVLELIAIITALMPGERTTGYYDFGEQLTLTIMIIIVLEFCKLFALKAYTDPILRNSIRNMHLYIILIKTAP